MNSSPRRQFLQGAEGAEALSSTRMRAAIRPRPELGQLSAYRLGVDAAVKLNRNESPLDWPPEFKAEVLRRVAARPWNRYPAVDGAEIREAFARAVGVAASMVAVANGSNEAILALVEAFATGRPVVLTAPGYSLSRPLAVIGGAEAHAVVLRPDFGLDVPAMLRAIDACRAAIVFLASPNNPTGNAFARADVEAILDAAPGVVVVDEAYVQFGRGSLLPDLARYPQLVVLRTFSKAFALAGARIGWIVGGEAVIDAVSRTLPPYNLNVFGQESALLALDRPDQVSERVRLIVEERERLRSAMTRVDGVTAYPSETNFILFRTALAAEVLFARLLDRGVLVRDVSTQPLLERCLRVTVGTPQENDRFVAALRGSLEDES